MLVAHEKGLDISAAAKAMGLHVEIPITDETRSLIEGETKDDSYVNIDLTPFVTRLCRNQDPLSSYLRASAPKKLKDQFCQIRKPGDDFDSGSFLKQVYQWLTMSQFTDNILWLEKRDLVALYVLLIVPELTEYQAYSDLNVDAIKEKVNKLIPDTDHFEQAVKLMEAAMSDGIKGVVVKLIRGEGIWRLLREICSVRTNRLLLLQANLTEASKELREALADDLNRFRFFRSVTSLFRDHDNTRGRIVAAASQLRHLPSLSAVTCHLMRDHGGKISSDLHHAIVHALDTHVPIVQLSPKLCKIAYESKSHDRSDVRFLVNRILLRLAYSLKPMPIINIALNMVESDNLAWQERKAKNFMISPFHAGSFHVGGDLGDNGNMHQGGYRYSKDYGRNFRGEPISLGTAMAISGAAASPNMGYHSSPPITFLMTFFNLRLGWWLGNTGKAGHSTYQSSGPRYSVSPLWREALGRTNARCEYVYLSDGGHFENLGLYEMVLRQCRYIVVVDAGRDPDCQFGDLGNAIRKVRIDFGIPIELQAISIAPWTRDAKQQQAPKYCAVGTIGYSRLDRRLRDGVLIYFKPIICNGEPTDVYNYALTNPGFPHQPTSDQWFNESQFESYRMLGSHIIDQLCGDDWRWQSEHWPAHNDTLGLFVTQVRRYLDMKNNKATSNITISTHQEDTTTSDASANGLMGGVPTALHAE
jgi:hypothetical protein